VQESITAVKFVVTPVVICVDLKCVGNVLGSYLIRGNFPGLERQAGKYVNGSFV